MIICPSRKPRSTVRGPTRSLNENSSPGSMIVPSMYSAISCTLWMRLDDDGPISVVKVEICSRIPSCSASAVVRSARVCFRRREARRIGDVAAAEIESEIQRAVGRQAGLRRTDPHGLPVDDEAGVHRALPPLRQEGLDRLRDPVGRERDAETGAVGAEADELRQALRVRARRPPRP